MRQIPIKGEKRYKSQTFTDGREKNNENSYARLEVDTGVSQSVDLGWNNNPNTTPTKDYKIVRVVVYLHGVQRGCAEEGERGSTPTG